MESDTREAMTPDPEMTLESAQGTIAEYEKPHVSRTVEETIQCQRAIGFLSGHAAGVKEYQALVKELVEAAQSALRSIETGGRFNLTAAQDTLSSAIERSARRMA